MTTDFSVKAMQSTLSNAVQACIERTSIIEFGIIKEIMAEGIVRVAVSAATSKEDIRILTCILVMPSGSSSMIKIVPKVNDKVAVFFPRRFTSDMFDLDFEEEDSKKNEIIIDPDGKGYTPFTGLAMLMNQFRGSAYKNFIITEEGKLSVNLAYDKDKNKNLFTLDVDASGSVIIENEKAKVSMKGEGGLSVNSNDVSISIGTDNSMTIDTSNAVISINASGNIEINAQKGKIAIKNSQADLKNILSGMLQTLNTTLNTSGSEAAQTVVPGQFTEQITNLELLM